MLPNTGVANKNDQQAAIRAGLKTTVIADLDLVNRDVYPASARGTTSSRAAHSRLQQGHRANSILPSCPTRSLLGKPVRPGAGRSGCTWASASRSSHSSGGTGSIHLGLHLGAGHLPGIRGHVISGSYGTPTSLGPPRGRRRPQTPSIYWRRAFASQAGVETRRVALCKPVGQRAAAVVLSFITNLHNRPGQRAAAVVGQCKPVGCCCRSVHTRQAHGPA
jgi:hypothetical protein